MTHDLLWKWVSNNRHPPPDPPSNKRYTVLPLLFFYINYLSLSNKLAEPLAAENSKSLLLYCFCGSGAQAVLPGVFWLQVSHRLQAGVSLGCRLMGRPNQGRLHFPVHSRGLGSLLPVGQRPCSVSLALSTGQLTALQLASIRTRERARSK